MKLYEEVLKPVFHLIVGVGAAVLFYGLIALAAYSCERENANGVRYLKDYGSASQIVVSYYASRGGKQGSKILRSPLKEVAEEIDRDITFTVEGDSTELHLLRNDMKVTYYWPRATEWERHNRPRNRPFLYGTPAVDTITYKIDGVTYSCQPSQLNRTPKERIDNSSRRNRMKFIELTRRSDPTGRLLLNTNNIASIYLRMKALSGGGFADVTVIQETTSADNCWEVKETIDEVIALLRKQDVQVENQTSLKAEIAQLKKGTDTNE